MIVAFDPLLDILNEIPVSAWVICAASILYLLLLLPKKSKKHTWRIRKADKVLKKLKVISAEKGEAAQFLFLRSTAVDPFTFEEAILTALKEKNIRIKRNRKYTGDGGIDGMAWWKGKPILIQAKLYSGHISQKHVESFSHLCKKRKALGLFVHSGRTGRASRSHLHPELDIISGERLLKLLCGDSVTLFPHSLQITISNRKDTTSAPFWCRFGIKKPQS